MRNFYYIRMRDQAEDLTAEIWAEGYIGIWFGAWEPTDLQEGFFDRSPASQQQLLTEINARNGLQWPFRGRELGVVRQFYNLPPEDWVCVCLGGRIHLGKIIGPPQRGDPAYDRQGQKFKWRPIKRVKSFELAQLPDPYRLVSTAGRGTLFQIQTYRPMMCVLEKSICEGDIWQHVDNMAWDDWLDFLGPEGWESLCLGYLVCQHHFVPTGLDIGRTLKDFDVLGANLDTGKKIYAQCKKDRTELSRPPQDFLDSVRDSFGSANVFLFAYGGCRDCPDGMELITANDLKDWFSSDEKGKMYYQLLRTGRGGAGTTQAGKLHITTR